VKYSAYKRSSSPTKVISNGLEVQNQSQSVPPQQT